MTWVGLSFLILVDILGTRFLFNRAWGSWGLSVCSNFYGVFMVTLYLGLVSGKGVIDFSLDYRSVDFEWQFYTVLAISAVMIFFHAAHVR